MALAAGKHRFVSLRANYIRCLLYIFFGTSAGNVLCIGYLY